MPIYFLAFLSFIFKSSKFARNEKREECDWSSQLFLEKLVKDSFDVKYLI